MPARSAASGVGEKKVVVIEYDKLEGTYLELGYWDEDIGEERFAALLQEGRIREEGYLTFDGNLLHIKGRPNTAISLKNETIFRCYCAPDLQNCRACFMRKRTIFAEGQAQLARLSRREAKAAARHFKAAARHFRGKAGVLEAEVAGLKTEVTFLESTATARDTELRASKAQVLDLKDFIAKRFAGEVHALGAAHPLTEFQRAADTFESEGRNVGLSARQGASEHRDGRAPTTDGGSQESPSSGFGGGVPSGSPDGARVIADADDGDVQVRLTSSAGPSRPPTSTSTRRPSSPSGARRHPSSAPALAVPASSGPELPPPRRRKLPAAPPLPALAVPARSGPEKPPGRSSWNSRSAQLDLAAPPAPIPVAAASGPVEAAGPSSSSGAVTSSSSSRKRKSASPPSDSDTDDNSDAPSPAKKTRGGTWTEHEKLCLIDVVASHLAAVAAGSRAAVHDTALWDVIQGRLMAEHDVDRGAQACRMSWNRGLRERSGIDDRLRPDPARMATSLQKKAGESA
ncbi:hypothetical protein V502_07600 [Pseudogymnoascus sp. VKM F-4520 (FW-2644)]|nr:hypothetical protein V502_07600 [Pseudogymnoascus sp. VKM F-4520 (FW-2644)]